MATSSSDRIDQMRRHLLMMTIGATAAPSLALAQTHRMVSVRDFDISGDGTDESLQVRAAARFAKKYARTLLFPKISNKTIYRFEEVDVAGLNVIAEPGVQIGAPLASSGRIFCVNGSRTSRITEPTTLRNVVATGNGTMTAFLWAQYADDVQLIDCRATGFRNMPAPHDGVCAFFNECRRPRVIGGRFGAAFYGVTFQGCINPEAHHVTVSSTGRHGILFYTEPGGTQVIDALAKRCQVSAYCRHGEGGVGGIQGYGCRRVRIIDCTVTGDNAQPHEDTAAIRFRDCEAFYCQGYDVSQCMTGVLALHLGTYDGAPYRLDVSGNIGPGSVHDCGKYGLNIAPHIVCDIRGAVVRNVADVLHASGIQHSGTGAVTQCSLSDMGCVGISTGDMSDVTIMDNKLKHCGANGKPAITTGGNAVVARNVIITSDKDGRTARMITRWKGNAVIGANDCHGQERC